MAPFFERQKPQSGRLTQRGQSVPSSSQVGSLHSPSRHSSPFASSHALPQLPQFVFVVPATQAPLHSIVPTAWQVPLHKTPGLVRSVQHNSTQLGVPQFAWQSASQSLLVSVHGFGSVLTGPEPPLLVPAEPLPVLCPAAPSSSGATQAPSTQMRSPLQAWSLVQPAGASSPSLDEQAALSKPESVSVRRANIKREGRIPGNLPRLDQYGQ